MLQATVAFNQQAKTASLMEDIAYHAPRVRLLDSVVGAGLGAGAGLATAGVRNLRRDKNEERSGYLSHAAIGGLLGATGANVVGDRARRYITNSVVPFGYETKGLKDMLLPTDKGTLYNRLIKDVPDTKANHHEQRHSPNIGLAPAVRREFWRTSMNLPTKDPMFKHVGDNTIAPDPAVFKQRMQQEYLFGLLFGGHSRYPTPDGGVLATDKWDFDWHPDEKVLLSEAFKNVRRDSSNYTDAWKTLAAKLEKNEPGSGHPPLEHIRSLLGRGALQALLSNGGANVRVKTDAGGNVVPLNQYTPDDVAKDFR